MSENEEILEQDDDMEDAGGSGAFIAGLVLGAALGAGAALLFAPQAGDRTRRQVGRRLREIRDDAGERVEEIADKGGRELRRRSAQARKKFGRAAREAMEALKDATG